MCRLSPCHCFMAISLVGISILADNKKETKSSAWLSSKRFCSRIALFFCSLCTDVSLPSGKPDREKGLFYRFFPEGGETSLHRLIFQAQMGKTSISYEFHGAQFFIVKLLTSIDSQLTISRQEWKNFGSDGKWRENLNSQCKKYILTAV